ncbi:MAG TPA: hypothetical protein VIT92_02450, partial [Burkholderiaceae bacterium]
MQQLVTLMRSPKFRIGCGAVLVALCVLAGRTWWRSHAQAQTTTELQLPDSLKELNEQGQTARAAKEPAGAHKAPFDLSVADKLDPDALLVEVYRELAANNVRGALSKADRLVEAYPKFRLGHLVRGDLLMMHANPVMVMGAAPNAAPDRVNDLRAEALQRLNALRQKPNPNLLPRAVLQMSPNQKYALLVDAKKSRLYVYQNDNGRVRFLTDYYITQGKLGVDK